eukprot:CAMPEP_0197174426 /NCGR_PEP_ID=MMETSP1423-20130617/951_1 /TAXON_ID=476441 /ORGANISM="Pseudo-nitzschia heimii, Strain UNC1101" /LENGTH=364 /DNA_ID=CAMNT_0042623355 /DNA_START=100 /DNA_END=1194 /DNA_ORIENTATION=+
MAPTLQQRAENAKKEIHSLQNACYQTSMKKRDATLAGVIQHSNQPVPLAPIRANVKSRRYLRGHFGKITALDWSSDSNTIVSASQDGNLLLWDVVTTTKKLPIRLKSAYVMSVAMDETGQFVAAGGLDNACTIYSAETGELKSELVSHQGYLADCKFFHSPNKILTSSADAASLLWDVTKGTIIDTFKEHKSNVTAAALNGVHTFLTSSTDRTIKLWDIRTSAKEGSVQTLTGHRGDVSGITVLPPTGGKSFVSCSEDGTVRVWDLRAYGEVSQFGQLDDMNDRDPFSDGDAGFTSITASKSGRLVFCGHSEGSVVCYDVLGSTTDPAYVLSSAHEEYISCLKISPCGDALCTGSWDFTLKIFA